MPPLWTGVAGQGNQKIYSLGGKWHSAGTTLPSGYTIVGDDGRGTLKMSWNGLPVNVAMQGSTIQPYTPPSAMPMAPAWMGGGALSSSEKLMADYYGLNNQNPIQPDPVEVEEEPSEEELKQRYGVEDRTGIDEFLENMDKKKMKGNYGTYDDWLNSSIEKRREGFNVWNNETQDFTDFFQAKE